MALKLIEKGYYVRVLDNLSKQIHGDNPEETSPLYRSIIGKVDFIRGSVTSREDWLRALDGIDTVLHLAAETGTGQSMYDIENYVNTNIGGTAIMLRHPMTNVSPGRQTGSLPRRAGPYTERDVTGRPT